MAVFSSILLQSASSKIDELLKKEDCKLEEILDESDVLQEVVGDNKSLIAFLLRKDNFTGLVKLVTTEPSADQPEVTRFRLANTASEILSSDIQDIKGHFVTDTSYLEILCDFYNEEKQLNPLLASFVSKVLGNLIRKSPEQQSISYEMNCLMLFEYLKSRGNFISRLLAHFETSAVSDLIFKLVNEVTGSNVRINVQEWLIQEKLIENLLDLLKPGSDGSTIVNASQAICETIRCLREQHIQNMEDGDTGQMNGKTVEPLLAHFHSETILDTILDNIFDGPSSDYSIVEGIQVPLTLLEVRQRAAQSEASEPYFRSVSQDTLKGIVRRLEKFHEVLLNPPKKRPVVTPSFSFEIPFGESRLNVCRLLATIVDTMDFETHIRLIELNTLNVMLDLMVEYNQNNFLHTQVERCMSSILLKAPTANDVNAESLLENKEELMNGHPLLCHVLRDCRLVERIVSEFGTEDNHTKQRQSYACHLVCIANYINRGVNGGVNENRIRLVLGDLPETVREKWTNFLESTLKQINTQNELLPMETDTDKTNEEDMAESLKAAERQSEEMSLHLSFLAYQTPSLTQKFENKLAFPLSQFDENEPFTTVPETLVSISLPQDSEELSRRQAMFEAACNESISPFDDDDIWADRGELGFSPGKATGTSSDAVTRLDKSGSSSSDDDCVAELGNVKMEVDPWSSLSAPNQQATTSLDNPWDSESRDATEFGNTDNWANFDSANFESIDSSKLNDKDDAISPWEVNTVPETNLVTPAIDNKEESEVIPNGPTE